jgi:transposase
MARKPHISHDLAQAAENAVRVADDAHGLRKAQAVLLPAFYSLDLVATGIAIGRSKASVCRLQAEFRADCTGIHIAKKKRGGRRRQNMSLDKEAQFLEPFFQKALEGAPLMVAEIRKAYETAVGKKVPASTVYRLLARHGWSPPLANRSMEQD